MKKTIIKNEIEKKDDTLSLLRKLVKTKKQIEELNNIEEKINKKLKNIKISKLDQELAGYLGLKSFLKAQGIMCSIKFVMFGITFFLMQKYLGIFSQFDLTSSLFFVVLTVFFSMLTDIAEKRFSFRKKKKDIESYNLEMKNHKKKYKELENHYKNNLITLNLDEIKSKSLTEINALTKEEQSIIKEHIELLNSEEAYLFNMVQDEAEKNSLKIRNY